MQRAISAVAGRLSLMLVLAVALAHLHAPGRPATVCLLRAWTGIPCPLCGGTTAAVRIGTGDIAGGLRASPLAVFGAAAVAALPVTGRRLATLPAAVRTATLLAALVASEIWQLHRFGWW